MDNLPVEVISHILEFLQSLGDRKAASLVCRLWYEAYQNPVFRNWEVVQVTADDRFQTLLNLKNYDRKYLHFVIKEIDITETSSKFWQRYGPNIRTLSILNCDIREKTFINVILRCENLESLCIQNCRELLMSGRLFEDEKIRNVLQGKLSNLKSLNLSYNRYLSDAIFIKFITICRNVTKLLLAGCQISFHSGLYKKYYPPGQYAPSESVITFPTILEYVRKNSNQLKYLSFTDTFIDSAAVCYLSEIRDLSLQTLHLRACQQLSNEGIVKLSSYQKSLAELDVALCPRVTDASLLAICSGLPNLKSLSVQRCRAVTDLGISDLWKLDKLANLNISECELIQGQGILKGLCQKPNLKFKELRLSHLGNISDDIVIRIAESLPNLTVLDLGFCYNAVTDRSVQSILSNIRYLRTLNLMMCEKVTDSGLTGMGLKLIPSKINTLPEVTLKLPLGSKAEIEIRRDAKLKQGVMEMCENDYLGSDFSGFSLKNLKGLQELNLSGCNRVSDVSLKHAFHLNELKNLELSYCQQITEEGLIFISKNNKSIESLNLDFCHNVNNEGVCHVVENLKRLRTFIVGSNQITDKVAKAISKYAKELTYLDIRHCDQVSSVAVNEIIKSLPRLQNFHFSNSKSDDVQLPVPPPPIGLWLKNDDLD